MARALTLDPGDIMKHTFVATWDFPNRYCRVPGEYDFGPAGYLEAAPGTLAESGEIPLHVEGHYYSNYFTGAGEVAAYAVAERDRLRLETERFHQAHYDSSLPEFVLDQVNSQLNTFRTSSWFTRDGNFGIIEGLSPTKSYAGLATTDVAMYGGIATAALFPELEKAVVRTHARFQNANGSVCHSISFNFRQKDPNEANPKRLDMPAQFAFQALRAALWYADREFLAEIWPAVKSALEYGLRERDHNGDGLPDMQGVMCSYDNFPMYGVAPYVATQWLAAYSAAIEAAKLLGDAEAEARFVDVLARGQVVLESTAWNGSYYRLYANGDDVDEGCMTDQIIGQWAAGQLNLPAFLERKRVNHALHAILKHNYSADQGLRNCQWPGDFFLHDVEENCWVDQANTCWTGVELAFAALLIQEGLVEEGFEIICNVDSRYRHLGMYWDHQEFGGHYFRPMSAWGILHAVLGYSMRDGVLTFDPQVDRAECKLLFVTADAYGHYEEDSSGIRLSIVSGELRAKTLRFRKPANLNPNWAISLNGRSLPILKEEEFLVVSLQKDEKSKRAAR